MSSYHHHAKDIVHHREADALFCTMSTSALSLNRELMWYAFPLYWTVRSFATWGVSNYSRRTHGWKSTERFKRLICLLRRMTIILEQLSQSCYGQILLTSRTSDPKRSGQFTVCPSGNQSKYDRAKPGAHAMHHIAYMPSVSRFHFHVVFWLTYNSASKEGRRVHSRNYEEKISSFRLAYWV